jgi:hypothetical protein
MRSYQRDNSFAFSQSELYKKEKFLSTFDSPAQAHRLSAIDYRLFIDFGDSRARIDFRLSKKFIDFQKFYRLSGSHACARAEKTQKPGAKYGSGSFC